ncbi:MAG: TIGR00296 family protein [Ignisphaera sp.]|nr:TIGR00296 family protein [Ignisphaera sp.]MCX8168109.1 TIGR00296 family protein [Ignisphaera sp.]
MNAPHRFKDVISPSEISLDDGIILTSIARRAIEHYVKYGQTIDLPEGVPSKLLRPGMAFVTIDRVLKDNKELRGCIGFLQPVSPLINTVINAAIAAATEDPRFPPLTENEIDEVVVEVSILSLPQPIKNASSIIIGKHGIIIHRGWNTGTLLPQVPIEYCWDSETFAAEGCIKAGLEPDCWLDDRTNVYVYEALVFYEETPRGTIKIRNLAEEFSRRCGGIL